MIIEVQQWIHVNAIKIYSCLDQFHLFLYTLYITLFKHCTQYIIFYFLNYFCVSSFLFYLFMYFDVSALSQWLSYILSSLTDAVTQLRIKKLPSQIRNDKWSPCLFTLNCCSSHKLPTEVTDRHRCLQKYFQYNVNIEEKKKRNKILGTNELWLLSETAQHYFVLLLFLLGRRSQGGSF